jgi:hypothetical protein
MVRRSMAVVMMRQLRAQGMDLICKTKEIRALTAVMQILNPIINTLLKLIEQIK